MNKVIVAVGCKTSYVMDTLFLTNSVDVLDGSPKTLT